EVLGRLRRDRQRRGRDPAYAARAPGPLSPHIEDRLPLEARSLHARIAVMSERAQHAELRRPPRGGAPQRSTSSVEPPTAGRALHASSTAMSLHASTRSRCSGVTVRPRAARTARTEAARPRASPRASPVASPSRRPSSCPCATYFFAKSDWYSC